MATLLTDTDSASGYFQLSEEVVVRSGAILRVDSELVEFLGYTTNAAGTFDKDRLRVKRGVHGSARASHVAGTTLLAVAGVYATGVDAETPPSPLLDSTLGAAITGLTAASAAAGANEIGINEAGTSKKLTVAQIQSLIGGAATLFVVATNASAKEKAAADYQCDGTADEVQINAALAALPATGGTVQLSSGTFTIAATIALSSSKVLRGVGWSTIVKAAASANINMITLSTYLTEMVQVRDLVIDGSKASQTSGRGIYFDNTGAGFGFSHTDPQHAVSNVLIYNTKNDGLTLVGDARQTTLDNVHAYTCDGNGFTLTSSDNFVTGCVAGNCGLRGFQIGPSAGNNHLIGCKAFGSGQVTLASGVGFRTISTWTQFLNCEAQDNLTGGFSIEWGPGHVLTGCTADSNGLHTGTRGYGFRFSADADYTVASGCYAGDSGSGTDRDQDVGFLIDSGATHLHLSGRAYNNFTADVDDNAADATNDLSGLSSIADLPAASAALGADELAVNEAGTTKKLTVAQVGAFVGLAHNVKDYGAVGNDSADDTTPIANAIAAAAGSGGRGVVYFPPGTYITSPITIPAGVVIAGATGQGFHGLDTTVPNANTKSVLKLKTGSTGPLLSPNDSGVTSSHVIIRDIALNGNGVAQALVSIADTGAFLTRYWSFVRCYMYNCGLTGTDAAVYIGQNNSACMFRECNIFNGTSGTYAGGRGLVVYGQDCGVYNTWIGYWANNCLTVLGGTGESAFNMFGGGIFGSGDHGANVAGAGATFVGVSFDTNAKDGAYVTQTNTAFIGCLFHDNCMVAGTNDNIVLASGTGNKLSVIGCRFPAKAVSANNMRSAIGDYGTGTILQQYGNMSDQTYTGSFTNYAGTVSAPSFPASTVSVRNTTGADVQAFIVNGSATITAVTLGATTTGLTIPASGTAVIRIPQGQTIAFTYASGTPTWTWVIG